MACCTNQPVRHAVWLGALLLIIGSWGSAHCGETQTYRVLQQAPCSKSEAVQSAPYAYGWFGASPRTHATRHFGYYKLYTEWSWR